MYNKKAVKCFEEGRVFQQQGKLSAAERAYKKAIKINSDFVEAHHDLGNVLLDRGRPKEAFNTFNKALKLRPHHPMLLTNLGNALQLQGEFEKAIDWFNKAITQDSSFAGAHNNLANACRDMGRYQQAVAAYKQAIQLTPGFADTYYNLGSLLIELDELDEAVINFNKAIDINPGHMEAFYGLGIALSDQGELVGAIASYSRAIKINPRHKEAYNGLGNALRDQGEIEKAIASYRQAIEIDPDHKEAYNGLGNALSDYGELEEAIAAYRQAIEIDPVHKDAHMGLGNALSDYGEIDQAFVSYRKAIEINPEPAEVYRSLSKNKKFVDYDDDIRSMESLYASEGLSDEQRLHLAFGLGKAYEDLGEYEKSIEFIFEATRLKRASVDYSISEAEDLFANIKAIFSPGFFSARKGMGCPDATPIFILGMPRSGTSLVEQILASHPDVFGAGELTDLSSLTRRLGTAGSSGEILARIVDLDSAALDNLGKKYIAGIRKHSQDAKYITDKMPHNFQYIGLIKAILPNARIIHCTRDPMDNCLSLFKNYFSKQHKYSYDLTELGQYYNLYVDLIEYWRKTLPDFIYDLSYERLVADQEIQIRNLLDYCQLPWDDACLEFHKTRRKVRTASNAQVRRPIYNDSVKLWKRYEKQLQPLRAAIYG